MSADEDDPRPRRGRHALHRTVTHIADALGVLRPVPEDAETGPDGTAPAGLPEPAEPRQMPDDAPRYTGTEDLRAPNAKPERPGPPLHRAEIDGAPVRLPPRSAAGTAGVVADRGNWDGFTLYAASQVGGDHEVRGRYREDSYAFGAAGTPPVVVVAVADGVSSSATAHTAAALAATHVVNALLHSVCEAGPPDEQHWPRLAQQAVEMLRRRLEPRALWQRAEAFFYAPQSGSAGPPAATLAFAVLHRTAEYTAVHWAGVGDTRIDALSLSSRTWRSLYRSGGGWTADNRTHALPRDTGALLARSDRLAADEVACLSTDGFAKGLAARPELLAEEIARMAAEPPKASDFLRLVDWRMPGNNDDRTVVLVWPDHSPVRWG